MRNLLRASLIALLLAPAAATSIRAQTAGESKLGVTVIELNDIIKGWSARRQILGQHVYNDGVGTRGRWRGTYSVRA